MSTVQQSPQTDYDRLVWEIEARAHSIRFYHLQTVANIDRNGGDLVKAFAEYRAQLDHIATVLCNARDFQVGQNMLAMAGEDLDKEIASM